MKVVSDLLDDTHSTKNESFGLSGFEEKVDILPDKKGF